MKKQQDIPIDFVILWVDGSDPEWLKEKKKYKPSLDVDAEINRYRDWGLLKYWFRGIDKYASWVNKIYFVTCGQKPSWLNEKNPKLKLINHSDYINKKYLPLYNSSAIESQINKIKGLSEHFVLFNDDMYLINNVTKDDFFKKGLPCDTYSEEPIQPNTKDMLFPHILLNNMNLVSKYNNNKNTPQIGLLKKYNIKYGSDNIKTFLSIPYRSQTLGFTSHHLPQSFLKTSFETLQRENPKAFEDNLNNRFRSKTDITQYAYRYYQLLTGNFMPRSKKIGKLYAAKDETVNEICEYITHKKGKMICINDTDTGLDFDKAVSAIKNAFEQDLSAKSSFEK